MKRSASPKSKNKPLASRPSALAPILALSPALQALDAGVPSAKIRSSTPSTGLPWLLKTKRRTLKTRRSIGADAMWTWPLVQSLLSIISPAMATAPIGMLVIGESEPPTADRMADGSLRPAMLILVCQGPSNVLIIHSLTTGGEFGRIAGRYCAFAHDGLIKCVGRAKLMRGLGTDPELRESILSGKAKVARVTGVSIKPALAVAVAVRGRSFRLFEAPARPKQRGVGMSDDAAWAPVDIARILFPKGNPIPHVEIDLFPNTVTVASKASVQRLTRALGPVKRTAKGRTAK